MNITDIARLAGVSKTTVSRVLSKSPYVKDSTREKVRLVIREHNYEPSYFARNLSRKRTFSVGVIIEEIANPYFIGIASEIEKILYEKKYTMVISSSQWNTEKELKIAKNMLNNSVDGFIIAPISPDSEAVALLKKSKCPLVLMNTYTEDEGVTCVATDDHLGGRLAAEHIFSNLRSADEQVIVISGYKHQNLTERLEGFYSYMDETGLDRRRITLYESINTYEDGRDLIPTLVTRNGLASGYSCLFVTNDYVAMGVQEGLLNIPLDVPDQVQQVGYDNIEFAGRCRVPLTTIEQSRRDIGRISTLELLELIDNPDKDADKFRLPPRLVVRASSPIRKG